MPSLSDKLQSLGVQTGAKNLKPSKTTRAKSVEKHLRGEVWPTKRGDAYVIVERYPVSFRVGSVPLWDGAPLQLMATWAGSPKISLNGPSQFAFLDTETTGLSGGSGTFAFLVGVGKFEGDEFVLAQFFLREPGEEPAQLAAIEEFIAGCETLVTFNGKSFDVPILNTRYRINDWPTPLNGYAHVDLLHLARKLWRARLPSRRLGDLEVEILAAERGAEEVPGWMVPEMYTEYLQTEDAEPLKGVMYHNAMDILSLASLMTHIGWMLEDPAQSGVHDIDLLSIAKLREDLGHTDAAQTLFTECLGRPLPQEHWLDAAKRLSFLFKRGENWEAAVKLWGVSAKKGEIYAYVELAKYFEHRAADLEAAKRWTEDALNVVNASGYPILHRFQWRPELEHRLARLDRKLTGLEEENI